MSKPYKILVGDCRQTLKTLRPKSVQCCITSPPYWGLRNYGNQELQIGQEDTPEVFVKELVENVFAEVHRILRDDGTLWLNIGDTYGSGGSGQNFSSESGSTAMSVRPAGGYGHIPQRAVQGREKQILGIPWRLAFALQSWGWLLRQDIIWHKPNTMPEPAVDRCVKNHEYIFLLTKQPQYYFDAEAIREKAASEPHAPGNKKEGQGHCRNDLGTERMDEVWGADGKRNKRSVWTVPTRSYKGAHFAVFPPNLIKPCILAGTSQHGACPLCGTPYERIVEKERVATRPGLATKATGDSAAEGNRDPGRHVTSTKTLGWQPGCDCANGAEIPMPRPCVVLDPFAGSGTTISESVRLGRRAIGCELNPGYLELLEDKIANGIARRGFGFAT